MARNFTLHFDPDSLVPDSTSHPDRGVVQHRHFWGFDAATVETLRTKQFAFPDEYTGSGTLKADVYYIMESATSGSVDWEVSVEAITEADAVDLDSAESFDTANAGNETVPATAGYLAVMTITLTNKDSVASGDLVRMKVERDADDGTNDTASGDARLLGVEIYEET